MFIGTPAVLVTKYRKSKLCQLIPMYILGHPVDLFHKNLNAILHYISGNIDSTKKHATFWKIQLPWIILWFNQESIMSKKVDDRMPQIISKIKEDFQIVLLLLLYLIDIFPTSNYTASMGPNYDLGDK